MDSLHCKLANAYLPTIPDFSKLFQVIDIGPRVPENCCIIPDFYRANALRIHRVKITLLHPRTHRQSQYSCILPFTIVSEAINVASLRDSLPTHI